MRMDLRTAFDKSAKLKNWKIPMPTYEEMEEVLVPEEEVLHVLRAGINAKHVGVAILTTASLHLLGRGTFKSLSPYNESIAFRHITGITRLRNLMYMGYTIEISRAANVDKLLGTDSEGSELFVKTLKGLVNSAGPEAVLRDPTQTAMDPLEQLKKLKDLLDAGIITSTEFEAKKKSLLDRI